MNRVQPQHERSTQADSAPDLHSNEAHYALEQNPVEVCFRACMLGYVAGIRSMTPLALLNWSSERRQNNNLSPFLLLTTLAAFGEIVADKLPMIPNRTSPGSFIGRVVIGGVAGMVLFRRAHMSPVLGIITGATNAGVGTITSYSSRAWLSKHTKIPGPLWGMAEDMLALGLGFFAIQKRRSV